jgi:hypothetical protein
MLVKVDPEKVQKGIKKHEGASRKGDNLPKEKRPLSSLSSSCFFHLKDVSQADGRVLAWPVELFWSALRNPVNVAISKS